MPPTIHGDAHNMNRPLCFLSAFFIFAVGAQINAQDSQAVGTRVGRRALAIDIDARVLEEKKEVVWEETQKKITIPGNPVTIKMVGSNVVLAMQFTPFVRRSGQNVLVAQGQIWINDPEKGMCYYTSIQTIPMSFGEPIYFFPLGPSQQVNSSSIEIILTVNLTENQNSESAIKPDAAKTENDK